MKFVFDTFVVPGAPMAIPQPGYDNAVNVVRPQLQALYASTFESADLDAIVFPTTPLPASPIIGSDSTVIVNGVPVPTFQTYIRYTDPGSVAGIPGISLPIALTGSAHLVSISGVWVPSRKKALLPRPMYHLFHRAPPCRPPVL